MSLQLQDLRYLIMPGTGVSADNIHLYNECYRLWKTVWQSTYQEVKPGQHLHSDGFSRQTRIGALYLGDECLGLTTLRLTNMALNPSREDSLLSAWTDEAYQLLVRDGQQVAICSYLTVAPAYRGEVQPGVQIKFLLTDLIALNFLDMGGDVMTGTMRISRGTQKAAYATGATFLCKSSMHNEAADLVAFYRRDLLANEELHSRFWAKTLWSQRGYLDTNLVYPQANHQIQKNISL